MRPSTQRIFIFLISFIFACGNLFAQEKEEKKADTDTTKAETAAKKKKPSEPKFEDVIEGYDKIEGLFTLYQNVKEGKVYMEIRQEQFGPTYLCNITRQSGDAQLFDSGAMLGEFPFFIKIVGKKVQFIQKNVAFRASPDAALNRAIEKDFSNSIWASAKIVSQPHPDMGSILVDAAEIFLSDYTNVGYYSGQAKMSYSFDKGDSYFSELKSFPMNTEIEVTLHYKSSKPLPVFTLPDSRSMLHRYHYSLSSLPETDYKPRMADDRIGHFVTMYQDYSSVLDDSPYKRYITRWQLEKSEPKYKVSKARQPIVFWLENTIPVEYRDAVKEGILLWNRAFEKIGIQDAIEVRQMPDDADWDPADVRYNTIRWIIQPGGGYAVGPSRANPFTGQIYDADVRVSADFVRFYYREFGEFVTPLSWQNMSTDELWPGDQASPQIPDELRPYQCTYAQGLTNQLGFGWSFLTAQGMIDDSPENLKKYIHDGIVALIVHEVGHTLGLRHNFKASSTVPLNELSDDKFTAQEGISGSVMDYTPVNLAKKGNSRGSYFQTTLGPYDYWAIEYAYKPLDPDSKESEKAMLEKIAEKVADPRLQYGTDEDALGYSTRGMDPDCNIFDLGSDPIEYYSQRTDMAQELWKTIPQKFDVKGEKYEKYRLVFNQGLTEYALAAATIPKYIGGIHIFRDHIGDPDGRPPFEVVPAREQRKALKFLTDKIFAEDAFHFSPDLLNKLAVDRMPDFENTIWRMLRTDYPIHGIVQVIQASAMLRLFDPLVLQRVQDNEIRFPEGNDVFTMAELFESVRKAVWKEVAEGRNVNSFRRELQRMHLYVLNTLVVNSPSILPHDAITLARADLVQIQDQIGKALASDKLDVYTRAHLEETQAKIAATLKYQIRGSY